MIYLELWARIELSELLRMHRNWLDIRGFPGGTSSKILPANADEMQVPSLGQEDPLEEGMGTHCLENPIDRGAWQATVLGVAESDTTKAT